MFIKKGDKVITRIDKFEYPKGTHGIIHQFEKDCVWVEVYINTSGNPDDIIRYKYSELESCDW